MSRVAFSPTFMVVTPSSQPVVCESRCTHIYVDGWNVTLDDLADANAGDKVAATDRRVEPENGREHLVSKLVPILTS
jgi:hypothetical protein